ncbi:MAG: hypothetical protein R3C59_18505 [Planctomycetaceae bacterium]
MLTNFAKSATTVLLVVFAISAADLTAQETGTSPVYRLQPGVNRVSIYEKFTTILEHDSRIKSVLDFDAEVLKVDAVHGHPNQITLYALTTGVTTITIIDEFGQHITAEVLVRGDVRHLESYLRRLYPNDAIQVEEIKGAVRLSGWVTKPQNINSIVAIAEQFYPNVMNHMETGGVQQVSLKATIMEVDRSKLRRMGMNFGLIGQDYFLNSTPGPITPITGLTASAAQGTQVVFSGLEGTSVSFGLINTNSIFRGFLDALKTEGLLKIHATPMLTTHNGQPAELLNGGEAPVVVPAGLGTTAIEFKPFGVIMNAVPHILGNGRLKLQVDASVVERDFANAVTVSGITVPSFTVRKVNTQVEMNFGETMVIGGLIQKREAASTAKVPFFGELPWIGTAFSKKSFEEAETELMILITPEYASPLSPEQIPAGGPGLFTDTVTDHELYFNGMIEVPKTGPECSAQFNCSNCQVNGYCTQHPSGCGPGCGVTEGEFAPAGGYSLPPNNNPPMLISPEGLPPQGQPIPMEQMEQAVPSAPFLGTQRSPQPAANSSQIRPVSGTLPTKPSASAKNRPGLITPFLR